MNCNPVFTSHFAGIWLIWVSYAWPVCTWANEIGFLKRPTPVKGMVRINEKRRSQRWLVIKDRIKSWRVAIGEPWKTASNFLSLRLKYGGESWRSAIMTKAFPMKRSLSVWDEIRKVLREKKRNVIMDAWSSSDRDQITYQQRHTSTK